MVKRVSTSYVVARDLFRMKMTQVRLETMTCRLLLGRSCVRVLLGSFSFSLII